MPWESELVGVSIGKVELDGATPEILAEIETEARDLGIECLYGNVAEHGRNHTPHLVQQHGYRLIEVGQLLDRPPGPYDGPPTESSVRAATPDDLEALAPSIDRLAPWSRFAADPRFGPEAARRMHQAWVDRAAREPDKRLLLIAEDESGVTGLSTNVFEADGPDDIGEGRGHHRVDLMGVIKSGAGVSQALMRGLFEWADYGPTQAGPCAARNIAVLRFCEGCGFSVCHVVYQFHLWLDERPLTA